jgi:hypothetical protein
VAAVLIVVARDSIATAVKRLCSSCKITAAEGFSGARRRHFVARKDGNP